MNYFMLVILSVKELYHRLIGVMLLLVMSMISVLLTSCENEIMKSIESNSVEQGYTRAEVDKQEETISSCELQFINNQYSIISKDEALKKGVSAKDYDILKFSIAKANVLIANVVSDLENEGYNVKIVDFSNQSFFDIASMVEQLATREEGELPSGTLETSNQTPKSEIHFAPIQMVGVRVNCIAHVALSACHVVTTKYAGDSVIVGTSIGPGYRTFTVAISMSNTNFEISYRTTDSNGGKCVWQGVSSI